MKKFWNSVKPIIYSYTAQYLSIFAAIIVYILLNKDKYILNDIDAIYKFTIIGITITLIPISIYLYKKYKIKETKIDIKKLLLMIPLGLSISLFYNMLTINFQTNKTIIDLNIILIVAYMVILGPIFEELVFRYVSLRKAKENYKENTAIIIISTIFALMHSGAINIIYAFLIGLALAKIYTKYNNILYPITLHISANLMSILISEFNLIALIISAISLILCYLSLKRLK